LRQLPSVAVPNGAPKPNGRYHPAASPASRLDAHRLALGALLVVSLAARLWRLDALPPGLWFDEAVDAHDALAVWHGARDLFFEGNLGREPLYMYALAPAVGLLGPGAVPIRLVSAAFGLAVVALTYPLGRAMFDRRVALAAAAFAAASYPLLHFSRTGFRAITLPAVLALGVWLAWLALRRDRLWLAAVGGAVLGLGLYTYSSVRFILPPLLLGLAVVALSRRERPLGRRLGAIAALWLAAAVVVAPLLLYFWQHPDVLSFRAQKMSFVDPRAAFGAWLGSAVDVLRMFVVSGDGLARHNLPGRPLLDPVAGALFVLGLVAVLAVARWRTAGLFVLLWLAAAVGPLTFSLENPHPLRSIGALPPVFLLAGAGLAWAWQLLTPLPRPSEAGDGGGAARRGARRHAAGALAVLAVAVSLGLTLRDYFVRWPADPRTYWETMADVAAAVRALPTLPPADRIYLAADEYRSRPEPFTALRGEDDHVQAFNGRKGLVFPDPSLGPVLYVMPASGSAEWPRIERFLPPGALVARADAPAGQDAFRAYRVQAAALQPHPSHPLRARFGDAVELLGYDLGPPAEAGGPTELVLYWRILQYRWYPWSWRAQLVDPVQHLRAGDAAYSDSLVTNAWRLNDVVASWVDVPGTRAPGVPAGYVALSMRSDDRDGAPDVPIADAAGAPLGTVLWLGPVRLYDRAPDPVPPDLVGAPTRFGGAIELLGYRLGGAPRAGAPLDVTLAWRATGQPAADYSYTVQLLDAEGKLVAQQDGPAGHGQLPTGVWQAGDVVVDALRVAVPANAPRGPLRLIVALYEQPSLRRLATPAGDHAELATISVVP
jgi:hypothetical protein